MSTQVSNEVSSTTAPTRASASQQQRLQPMPTLFPQYPPAPAPSDRPKGDSGSSSGDRPGPSQPFFDGRYRRASESNGAVPPDQQETRRYPPPPLPPPLATITSPAKQPSLSAQTSGPSPPRTAQSTTTDTRRASANSPPAVLVREKKQKACANCRKAKLKCIVDPGENDCVRCKARKERCVFYPRSHDEDWQQTLTSDVYTAISHLSDLSRAVQHILHSLTSQRIIPPLPGPPLERYEPAYRDLTVLQGWGVERNKDEERKRKRAEADDAGGRRRSMSEFQRPQSDHHQHAKSSTTSTYSWPHSIPSSAPPNVPLPVEPSVIPRTIPEYPPTRPPFAQVQSGERYFPTPYPLSGYTGAPPSQPPPAISPNQQQGPTPGSLVESSPGDLSASPAHWITPQGVPASNDSVDDKATESIVEDSAQVLDEDGEEVYGSADGRMTIISKGIIPAKHAKTLVEYFHACMSPHLFGYNLQLREFPYLSDGPRSITPFILAVECLLASERVPELYTYHGKLADAVLNMLLTSPAESWQTIQGSEESRLVQDQVLGHALDAEEAWDPELGIGPEEIVAGCALASFISQRNEAKFISLRAFNWAKGWCNYLRAPNTTFVEATGLVPPLRRPSESNMARVWLLAYIVAAQELVQHSAVDPILPTDPSRWCRVLLPDDHRASPTTQPNPHDVLLVYHARLASLLIAWLKDRHDLHRLTDEDEVAASVASHKRLASRTNAHLDWWSEDLKVYGLTPEWTNQIQLDWLHAKHLVNSVASKNTWGGRDEEAARENNKVVAVECAMQLLQRCMSWNSTPALTNLPHPYVRMITLAAGEVADAVVEVEQGSWARTACPVSLKEVLPILQRVRSLFLQGGMQDGHYCRHTAHALHQHIESLQGLT